MDIVSRNELPIVECYLVVHSKEICSAASLLTRHAVKSNTYLMKAMAMTHEPEYESGQS